MSDSTVIPIRRGRRGDGSDGTGWPDVDKNGMPRATFPNAIVAIQRLGHRFSKDEFKRSIYMNGLEIADHVVRKLRVDVYETYGFDPGKDHMHEAVYSACERNTFDSVCDYLDRLSWDGTRRIDTWLTKYLQAEETAFTAAVGRIVLVAAVRRARAPGTKFDTIMVLESPEGYGKSSAVAILAGPSHFSDQTILGQSDERQQEKLRGVWLYEIADLGGMRKSEVEHVKAFASRTHDRARAAYERLVVSQPRRGVIFGTTNDDKYLKSQTGNRRFWPVKLLGAADEDALRRDRDQLWAEASTTEAIGAPITLPRELWMAARIEQDERTELPALDDYLANLRGEHCAVGHDRTEERVRTVDVLRHLGIPAERAKGELVKDIARAMHRLGWQGPKVIRVGGSTPRGYIRSVPLQE